MVPLQLNWISYQEIALYDVCVLDKMLGRFSLMLGELIVIHYNA